MFGMKLPSALITECSKKNLPVKLRVGLPQTQFIEISKITALHLEIMSHIINIWEYVLGVMMSYLFYGNENRTCKRLRTLEHHYYWRKSTEGSTRMQR
jgi:hypothetical protein